MPIYEYECNVCQCRFERKQGFDAEPVVMCPECQGKARRVINSIPVIFKGSGFYITDSRKSMNLEERKKPEKEKGLEKSKEESPSKGEKEARK